MTREDWYMLILTAACVIGGTDKRDVHYNASKLVRKRS